MVNPMQLAGRDGFGRVHAPALTSNLVQMEPTLTTFHEDRSWLKDVALSNIVCMSITFAVFHSLMS